jgi:hypothetical protein
MREITEYNIQEILNKAEKKKCKEVISKFEKTQNH